jgi:hypothetical protein
VSRPLILALTLASATCGCAVIGPRPPREAVMLPQSSAVPFEEVPTPAATAPDTAEPVAAPRRSSRCFEIESAALTRAFGRPRTLGVEVVLPEGFKTDEDLPIAYHVPDIGQDPADVAEHFAKLDKRPRLVLVVLDPRGINGHHAFVDSVNEGPYGAALVTDLIPVLEQHLFAGSAARRRFLTGVGLGGWSVIHLQLEYCHAFDGAYAFDPEPLDQRNFYGCDLTRAGTDDPSQIGPARHLKNLREGALNGRLTSMESAFGARGDDGRPLPLFADRGEHFDLDVVAAFARQDPAAQIRERGAALAPRLAGKIHAFAHNGDALDRDLSLRSFAATLEQAQIAGTFRTFDALDVDEAILLAWSAMTTSIQP